MSSLFGGTTFSGTSLAEAFPETSLERPFEHIFERPFEPQHPIRNGDLTTSLYWNVTLPSILTSSSFPSQSHQTHRLLEKDILTELIKPRKILSTEDPECCITMETIPSSGKYVQCSLCHKLFQSFAFCEYIQSKSSYGRHSRHKCPHCRQFIELPFQVYENYENTHTETSPEISPEISSGTTSEISSEISSETTSGTTSETSPEISSVISPEISSVISPEISSEISPEPTSESTPIQPTSSTLRNAIRWNGELETKLRYIQQSISFFFGGPNIRYTS
jgi:hypothetical protein